MRWDRARGQWHSKYFSPKEFECTCGVCARQMIDDILLKMLDEVREEVGLPIRVTSGFRCARRQDMLRKQGLETAVGKSAHEMGFAADITCSDMLKLEVACNRIFRNYSIGVAETFFHVDIRTGGPRRWYYK